MSIIEMILLPFDYLIAVFFVLLESGLLIPILIVLFLWLFLWLFFKK